MTQEQIKAVCNRQYEHIEYANQRLQDMRSHCKHPKTIEGNYSYRVGVVQPATICSDCGELIRINENHPIKNLNP